MQQQSHLPRQHLHQQRSPYPVQQVNQFQGKNPLVFPVWSQWPKGSKCVKACQFVTARFKAVNTGCCTHHIFYQRQMPKFAYSVKFVFPFLLSSVKTACFFFFFPFPSSLLLNDICFASLTSRCHGFIHRFILLTSTLRRFFPASTSDCILVLPLLHSPLYLIR